MSWLWKILYLVLPLSAVILFDSRICYANESMEEPSIEELTQQQEMEKLISAAGDPAMLDQLALDPSFFDSLIAKLNKKANQEGDYQTVFDYLIKVYKRLPAPFSSECYASMGCTTAVNRLQTIIENDFNVGMALYISFISDNDSNTPTGKARAQYFKEVRNNAVLKEQRDSLYNNNNNNNKTRKNPPASEITTYAPAMIPEIKAEALDLNCGTEKIFSDIARTINENSGHIFLQKNLCGQDVIVKIIDRSTTNTKLFLTTIEISKCQTQVMFRTQLQSHEVKVIQSALRQMSDRMYTALLKKGPSTVINTYHPSIDYCRTNMDAEEHY